MPQNTIIYLDIAAVVIMSISLASLLLRGLTKGAANRVYLSAMVLVTLTAISALGGEIYDAYVAPAIASGTLVESEIAHTMRSCCAMLYYALRSLTAPAYLVLIATVSDTTHKLNDTHLVRIMLWVPLIAVLIGIFTNPIHHLLFVFDNGILVQGPMVQAIYAEAIYYSVEGIIWLFVWRKLFSSDEFTTLLMLYPIMLASMIIQYNVPSVRLEMFITSIAMLLVSAFVIHPETRHDAFVDAASLQSYEEMVNRAFASAKPMCLVFLEIVNIEQLRQLKGKIGMQSIMSVVADKLTSRLERDDVLYYLHNGVFCISSRNTDINHALLIASKTHREGKAQSPGIDKRNPVATMRTCIVRVPEDISDRQTLTNFGMCFARLAPESCVTTYQELSQRDDFELQMALSTIVTNAIENHSFEVYYQPIYCVSDGRFHSAEALVRLNDPKLGWVPPSLFVLEAEKNGLILNIGSILLEKICMFLGAVDYEKTDLDYVEANLSVDQCANPYLADELLGYLKRYNVDPRRLNAEITETSEPYSQEVIDENVHKLAEAGVTVSLDDYGTGYSNVTRLLRLPFSLVKFDKSFVDDLDDDSTRTVLADSICMMKSIGKKVLIEGVETKEQAEKLIAMGIDYIQGFYYAKPMPEDDFLAFLKKSHQ